MPKTKYLPMSKPIATVDDVVALEKSAKTHNYNERQRQQAKPKYTPTQYMKNLIRQWLATVDESNVQGNVAVDGRIAEDGSADAYALSTSS